MKKDVELQGILGLFSAAVLDLPNKFQITHRGQRICEVNIEVILPRSHPYYLRRAPFYELLVLEEFLTHFGREIRPFLRRLEADLDLRLNYRSQIDDYLSPFSHGGVLGYLLSENWQTEMGPLSEYIYRDKTALSRFLKEAGPRILANAGAQKKMEDWASARRAADLKQISKALCDHINPKGLPDKLGRPSPQIDLERLRLAYKYLRHMLTAMKKCRDWQKLAEFEDGFLKVGQEKRAFPKERVRIWRKYQTPAYTLYSLVETDDELKRDFYEYRWQPYELALVLLAKLLGISTDKLQDILYKRKRPIRKRAAAAKTGNSTSTQRIQRPRPRS